jgi:hypothetical protein
MLSPITKEIDNFSVRFRPLPATKAFTLAKRVGALVLPLLKSFDISKLNAEVDLNSIIDGVIETLSGLPDDKAVGIIVDSLQGCTIVAPGKPAIEINGISDVDEVFQGELEAMYSIVLESWKYNKLAPFKLAARFGLQPRTTATSEGAEPTETRPGPGLALSGHSPVK